MLVEITVTDFAIADHLRVEFAPGLNVLTGETGAGKSIVADALALLLGGRGDTDWIRAGSPVARIEGRFELGPNAVLAQELVDAGLEGDEELVMSREISTTGRGAARVNARSVPISVLASIGRLLADIHGQNDYLSLFRPAEQLQYLDRFGGTVADLGGLRRLVSEVRALRAERESLLGDERERVRTLDRISFELAEIGQAGLETVDEGELRSERDRLANAEHLATAADAAYQHLAGGDGQSAADRLGEVAQLVAAAAALDATIAEDSNQAEALVEQVSDLARQLRAYRDGIEFNPVRQAELEERLDQIANLKRKYGASVADVLAYAREIGDQRDRLVGSGERLIEIQRAEAQALHLLGDACGRLSIRRRDAAGRLAGAVETELRELGMERARFAVRFLCAPSEGGVVAAAAPVQEIGTDNWEAPVDDGPWAFDPGGIDRVEFLVSLNAGEPVRPLAKVASGGETARIILALKSILGARDETSVLVFDEVDTGVGGRSGRIIGQKLARLGDHHQVLCITHLPQIACYADRHIGVTKREAGGRTTVAAGVLEGGAREAELAAMLGGVSPATRASARELLKDALRFREGNSAASRSA